MKVKDLQLKNGQEYKENFVTGGGKYGYFIIERYNNRHYFFAKIYGHELPMYNYKVNKETNIDELRQDCQNGMQIATAAVWGKNNKLSTL